MGLGVRSIVALTAPAAAGMVALAPRLVAALMERGQFDAGDTANTAAALRGLAIGLVGFSVYLFALRGFYAHDDTRTPFWLNVGENGLNVVLALVLVGPFGVFGLGLALAIAYLVSAVIALVVLDRRHGHRIGPPLVRPVIAMITAAGVALAAMSLIGRAIGSSPSGPAAGLAVIGAIGAGGAAVYAALLVALRVDGVGPVLDRVRRAAGRGRRGG
jgi:putative peptidoglycan lipid II flippase